MEKQIKELLEQKRKELRELIEKIEALSHLLDKYEQQRVYIMGERDILEGLLNTGESNGNEVEPKN